MIALDTPLEKIRGIAKFINKLKKLGIVTVKDLLWHFPARYEDFSQIYSISDLIPGQEVTIQGEIEEIESRESWRRNLAIVEAIIADETGNIKAIWFNQPYIRNVLQVGRMANFSGKVTARNGDLYLSNPTYEIVNGNYEQETKHTARIVPIYPETKGLTSRGIRYLIQPILKQSGKLPEIFTKGILEQAGLPDINTALKQIHFPNEINEALKAKKRFAFEDLFFLQLHNLRERMKLAVEKSPEMKINIEEIKQIIETLPFELTLSQKKSLWEILQDLEKPNPMNRLLQGDVGSGKTIVAAIAAMICARNGYQTAFMAPTEILARQHYQTFPKFFSEFEGGIALLTGSESKVFYGHKMETDIKKTNLTQEIANGKIQIIIGTHALISSRDETKKQGVIFGNLGLVVVDEQHRFGVSQRAALVRERNHNNNYDTTQKSSSFVPNLLSMSATPIPRTLSLTLFGDLDLSLITELPKDRKPIITNIIQPQDRNKTYQSIRAEIKKGRQAFVICPRIEVGSQMSDVRNDNRKIFDANKWEVKSVKEEYEKLSKKVFPDLKVAMLHGKMKPKEKEKTMREFKDKKSDILVATSVIEVGIDIQNATIMIIEGAERFGLAQLYQFRGRVGRGEHQSYCFLFTESSSRNTKERLQAIMEAKNGFELAEKDLKIRGPGEFLGTSQTGMPDIAMKALQNPELIKTAREVALSILQKDSIFKYHQPLLKRLEEFQEAVHFE